MKKIEAIIRESKFNEVKEVLIKLGVGGMTTYEVKGRGSQIGQTVPPGHPSSSYADDLVPKRKIETINDTSLGDQNLLGKMILVAKDLAKKYNINESGYRLLFNTNADAMQTVFHIHLHLIGGEKLKNI